MSNEFVITHESVRGGPAKRFVRNKDVPLEKETIRERLVSARVMNGMTAVQAAERMGYKNSTQISQIEAGERKLPNDWQFLLKMSAVYRVSVDFLLGVSPNPERDAIASETFALMRGFEELLQSQAATMTTAFCHYAAQGKPTTHDMQSLCDTVEKIHASIRVIRERNPEFDDMRGGATVLKAAEELETVTTPFRMSLRRRKANEAHFINLASGKTGPLKYLIDRQQPGLDLEG